ncbi:hypothetical protein EJ04DRAFT_184212 [Polyplosphaeria fusca]|uniref:Uncharacterized protein n=1 Tax=Polyplosphaeria fusca TaxID=682080 RepID=A0A9P4QZK0_9PLEO|nr:hypothetical protein EJ04DRAFT_184212 [Polyplosphaeria fusca]
MLHLLSLSTTHKSAVKPNTIASAGLKKLRCKCTWHTVVCLWLCEVVHSQLSSSRASCHSREYASQDAFCLSILILVSLTSTCSLLQRHFTSPIIISLRVELSVHSRDLIFPSYSNSVAFLSLPSLPHVYTSITLNTSM